MIFKGALTLGAGCPRSVSVCKIRRIVWSVCVYLFSHDFVIRARSILSPLMYVFESVLIISDRIAFRSFKWYANFSLLTRVGPSVAGDKLSMQSSYISLSVFSNLARPYLWRWWHVAAVSGSGEFLQLLRSSMSCLDGCKSESDISSIPSRGSLRAFSQSYSARLINKTILRAFFCSSNDPVWPKGKHKRRHG
jgi:hypothetical protein